MLYYCTVLDVQYKMNCLRYAKLKFSEMDDDGSGYLESTELNMVVDWILDLEEVILYFMIVLHTVNLLSFSYSLSLPYRNKKLTFYFIICINIREYSKLKKLIKIYELK